MRRLPPMQHALPWDALGAHIEQFLATATLADVLRGRYSVPAARFSLSELAAAAKVQS
jgi:hypothetical protein